MFKKVSVAFVFVCILMVVNIVSVGAVSNLELSVSPTSITTCSDRVLTSNDIKIYVKNLLPKTDTVSLSITWVPNGQSAFIKPEITLASGEEKFVDTVFINVPYTLAPDTYTATIRATSLSTGETVTKDISITVLGCHILEITPIDTSKNVCDEETGTTPVSYTLTIRNPGKFDEIVQLSAEYGGLPITWATFSDNNIKLLAQQSKTITMTLIPPSGLGPGTKNINVKAKSLQSFAEGSTNVMLNINKCYDFSAEISPSDISGCAGLEMTTSLTVRNTGEKSDTYNIITPNGVTASLHSITLNPGNSETIQITYLTQFAGEETKEITVKSSATGAEKTADFTADAEECRGVAVFVSPTTQTACKNTQGVFVISVKNTGALKDTFTISTNVGELSKVQSVNLQINTQGIESGDTIPIKIKVTDGIITSERNAELTVMTCYEASIDLTPETVGVCPNTEQEFSINIKNTGVRSDTYNVGIVFNNQTYPGFDHIEIAPDNSKTLKFVLPIEEEAGTYTLYVTASSPYISVSDTASVTIKSKDVCYAARLTIGDGSKTIQTSKAMVVPVIIENTGEVAQNFSLVLTGPGWIYLSPRNVYLEGNEEGTVYLYISPPYNTLVGDYKADIVAVSENTQTKSSVEVSVISGITAPENITLPEEEEEIEIPEENITEPEENVTENITEENVSITPPEEEENVSVSLIQTIPNITINATIGNITGLIGGVPFSWKTIAVIVITIIIILVLIVRFALLLK